MAISKFRLPASHLSLQSIVLCSLLNNLSLFIFELTIYSLSRGITFGFSVSIATASLVSLFVDFNVNAFCMRSVQFIWLLYKFWIWLCLILNEQVVNFSHLGSLSNLFFTFLLCAMEEKYDIIHQCMQFNISLQTQSEATVLSLFSFDSVDFQSPRNRLSWFWRSGNAMTLVSPKFYIVAWFSLCSTSFILEWTECVCVILGVADPKGRFGVRSS